MIRGRNNLTKISIHEIIFLAWITFLRWIYVHFETDLGHIR